MFYQTKALFIPNLKTFDQLLLVYYIYRIVFYFECLWMAAFIIWLLTMQDALIKAAATNKIILIHMRFYDFFDVFNEVEKAYSIRNCFWRKNVLLVLSVLVLWGLLIVALLLFLRVFGLLIIIRLFFFVSLIYK